MSVLPKPAPTLIDLQRQRTTILALAERYGVTNIRIFGSVARGEATTESDIDFLVTVKEGVSMFDLVGLWLDLRELLGYEVSLVTDDDTPRQEHFMQRITDDLISL